MEENFQQGEVSVSPSKKTVFLLSNLTIGGSERKIVRVANGLAERGHHVCVAYLNGPEDLLTELSEKVEVLFLNRRGKFSFKAASVLFSYLKRHKINSIFSVNLYPVIYVSIVKLFIPKLCWIALINTTNFLSWKDEAKMFLYGPLLQFSSVCVFGNKFHKSLWMKRYYLSESKSQYIYNGIDIEKFSVKKVESEVELLCDKYGISAGFPIIGTVGKMRPEKRQDLLIKAVAMLRKDFPNIRGLNVGDGETEVSLKQYSRDNGVERNIVFLGSQMDVRPALGAMDIFVLTSTSVETFSNAALEAMSMSKPVVLSDISGAQEMIEDGINGYISIPDDVTSLVGCIKKITDSMNKNCVMGDASRNRVETFFTFEKMLDSYEKLLYER